MRTTRRLQLAWCNLNPTATEDRFAVFRAFFRAISQFDEVPFYTVESAQRSEQAAFRRIRDVPHGAIGIEELAGDGSNLGEMNVRDWRQRVRR